MIFLAFFSCPNCSWWLLPLLLGALLLGFLWWNWTRGALLRSRVSNLTDDLSNWKAKFKENENRLADSQYEHDKLTGEYATLKSRIGDYDAKYLALEEKHNNMIAAGGGEMDTSDYSSKIADMELQLNSSREINLKLQEEYAKLKMKFNELEAQIGNDGPAMGVVGNVQDQDRIDDLEKKLAIAYEYNSKLESEYANLKSEYGNLQIEKKDIDTNVNPDIESYQLRIAELETQLASAGASEEEEPGEGKKKKKKKNKKDGKKKKGDKNQKKKKKKNKKGKKKEDIKVKAGSGGKSINFAGAFAEDNLQIIEGIGPKIEQLLKGAQINSWAALANSDDDRLRAILLSGGPRYKMHDPSSWAHQAELAQNGDWLGLVNLQKGLGGASNKITDAKVEKLYAKALGFKSYKLDDLKVIEGIGPKIEGLLEDAGLNTWKKLSEASVEAIQKVLDEAGPRYKLANPGTWARQAKLAHDGDWAGLKTYQDELDGGKDKKS